MSEEAEEPTSVDEEVEVINPDDMESQIEAALRESMQIEDPVEDVTPLDEESQGEQAAAPLELDAEPEPEPEAQVSEGDQDDIAAYFRQSGIEPTREAAQQLVEMRNWYEGLSQAEVDAVNGTIENLRSGESATPQPEPVAPAAPALQIPGMDMFDEDERAAFGKSIADYVQQTVDPMQQELARNAADREQAQRERMDKQDQEMSVGITAGQEAFQAAHPELTETDLNTIQNQIVQAGTWQSHYIASKGDAEKATLGAYEQVLLSDEGLRARYIAAELQAERDKTANDDERIQNLAALSGGGSPAAADTVSSQASQFDDPLVEAIAEAQRNMT